jgi:ferredoxin
MSGVRLQIDRIACDGRGYCADLFPEMIHLDDWGFPIIAPGEVPTHLRAHARRAVASCPVIALRLAAEARAEHQGSPVAARRAVP